MEHTQLLTQMRGGLIVSCQALADEPLFGAEHMAAMARAAARGGAVAVRANGPTDIAAIRAALKLPIHEKLGLPVLVDVSTFEEGMEAIEAGADFVATTLSGYTSYSPSQAGPDFNLLKQLVTQLHPQSIPVIAEGRITTPDLAAHALALGAHAVVVGGAITRPQWITAQYVNALKKV